MRPLKFSIPKKQFGDVQKVFVGITHGPMGVSKIQDSRFR